MNKTYLLLGSNLGNSRRQLRTSIKHIGEKIGKVAELRLEGGEHLFADGVAAGADAGADGGDQIFGA